MKLSWIYYDMGLVSAVYTPPPVWAHSEFILRIPSTFQVHSKYVKYSEPILSSFQVHSKLMQSHDTCSAGKILQISSGDQWPLESPLLVSSVFHLLPHFQYLPL